MKNKITFAIYIMLLSAILLSCKCNFGGDNSTSGSDSSNAANRSTAKSDAVNKTVANSKLDGETGDDHKTGDDLATSEDAPDSESDTSRATDFRIKRSYYALDENRPADLLNRDGDYMYFKELERGGTAGFFYSAKPEEAIYVLWGGKVISGPLTTDQQVQEVTAMLSNNIKAEHEMRMSIIKNRPTGILGPVRVYDEKGNLVREH